MKRKLFTLLAVILATMCLCTEMMAVTKNRLMALVQDVKSYDGVELVKVGSLGTAAIKALVKLGAVIDDEDARNALDIIKGINKVVILDYEDCDDAVKAKIASRAASALEGSDLLMEVKDGEDHMQMYGVVEGDGSEVSDFVMYDSEGCALICLFGRINVDTVMKLAK